MTVFDLDSFPGLEIYRTSFEKSIYLKRTPYIKNQKLKATKFKMKLFSLLSLYGAVNAQSFEPNPNWSDGQCPELPSPVNFDTDAFFGEWQM